MMNKDWGVCWRLLASLIVGLFLVGCQTGYDLTLSLDPQYAAKLGDQRVFVHVAAVNPNDRAQLENMSLEAYWQYGDTKESPIAFERHTKMFELSTASPAATLSGGDPVWSAWRSGGATELMVLSSLPIPSKGMPGESDPRRRFIPIFKEAWAASPVLIMVTESGLRVQTPMARSRQ